MAGRLNGKVALVTGGSSGIGLATAKLFVAEGASVYITGRNQEALDSAVVAIGGNVTGLRADSGDVAALHRLYLAIKTRSGKLDVLFVNAGVGAFVPLQAITEGHFDTLVHTNLKGVVFTVKLALPVLTEGASIIINSSTAAYRGMESFSIYSATKAAVRQLARSWISDLRDQKIRVNVVSPSLIDTPAIDRLIPDAAAAAGTKDHVASLNPLGRIGKPEDVAAAALFLASDEAAYINGVDLPVDGGSSQI